MFDPRKFSWKILVAPVAVAFSVLLFWDIILAFYEGVKSLEPTIYVPLSVTLFTAISGLLLTLANQRELRRRENEAAFRDRKIEVYLEILTVIGESLKSQKPELTDKQVEPNEIANRYYDARLKASLWASSAVLDAMREFFWATTGPPGPAYTALDKMQRAMRDDLSLSNSGLESEFFIKSIMSNQKEYEKLQSMR